MKITRYLLISLIISILFSLPSCGPKTVESEPVDLKPSSKAWVPFYGLEYIVFKSDTGTIIFKGQGRNEYYENKRYMTDASGFFSAQKDYYADFEREELTFESDETPYIITYKLESDKGDVGEWNYLTVKMIDGTYYKNELKMITYTNSDYDFGQIYSYKKSVTLNGTVFDSVYYLKQSSRPMELYYTKKDGVIAFKLNAQELWTIEK
jgi:hypothetical protein